MAAIIQALDGSSVDLFDPRPEWFRAETVAHALADKNRFCGQATILGYSVAEHCVRVSRWLDENEPRASRFGLLHEFDEVFLPDIPAPLKREPEMQWYRDICDRHMRAGSEAFGLPWPWPEEIVAAVKRADNVLLATEARDLMVGACDWAGHERIARRITPWEPWVAKESFLARLGELGGGPR